MEGIQLRTLRRLRNMQMFGFLFLGFSSITAMDADNMGSMFDAYETPTQSDSESYSSSFSAYASPSSVSNNLDNKHHAILHKHVDNLTQSGNYTLLDFYDEKDRELSDEEIHNLDKKHRRLKRRLEEMDSVIEGTSKNGKSELFQLLPKNQDVANYDVVIDGLVNPKTGKIEFNSHIIVLLNPANSNEDDDEIIEDVKKIKKDLKHFYNIKNVGYNVEKEEIIE